MNTQRCAACRYKRKKCNENCEMALYFPGSRYSEFQHAQKLFGVRNIQKILASEHVETQNTCSQENIKPSHNFHNTSFFAIYTLHKIGYKRKKCSENCEMALYFPGSRYSKFQHAQKFSGARFKDPMYGSLGIV
ncbi:hypothetical protein EZV62_021308 [Acer yangbiense]|uniref:LOB domain-containing protein n=1 Tax=Acer yangbiense TaxID=1000413 RepID=A0A5C7H5Z2_9ROSI|nr:hypothetical protein EZV62_021308 [Acer yangbiense]